MDRGDGGGGGVASADPVVLWYIPQLFNTDENSLLLGRMVTNPYRYSPRRLVGHFFVLTTLSRHTVYLKLDRQLLFYMIKK